MNDLRWPYALTFLSVADWTLTSIILVLGGVEANPVASIWFESYPLPMFLWKCFAVPLLGFWAWGKGRRVRVVGKVAVGLHVPVVLWNIWVLVSL